MSAQRHPSIDFDHTCFAVHDALAVARQLRATHGATPITGETLEAFRYLMLYIGSEDVGTAVEFIEPIGVGFLDSYLAQRGPSAHHLTFTVDHLVDVVATVRDHGFGVVDEDYAHASWQEAFIRPDATHRTIIQLASSDRQYPTPRDLLTSQARAPQAMPHIHGATDRTWWTSLWQTPAGATKHLGPTVLKTTNMDASHELFGTILRGQVANGQAPGGVVYSWPSGAIEVVPSDTAGIVGIRTPEESEVLDLSTITMS